MLLRDDEDAEGLTTLLNDVRSPGAEALAEFKAPMPRGAEFLRQETTSSIEHARADGDNRTLILMDEPGLESLVPKHPGSFIVGVADESRAERYAHQPRVATFVASGPLDFAAEIMARFSGPDATIPVFDPDEAARMRALATGFPVDLDYATSQARDRLEQGRELWADGQVEDALRAFDEALEFQPNWAEAHLWRGFAFRKLIDERSTRGLPAGDLLEQARTAFRAALDAGYSDQEEIGDHLLQLGDYAGAQAAFRQALSVQPDTARLHTSLGTALALDEELDNGYEQACAEYTRALALDRDSDAALRSRGVARINLCQYENALLDLERARELDGGANPSTHLYRVIALSALGDLIEARRAAVLASRLGKDHDRRQWIEYMYAVALLRLDDLSEAMAVLERAERLAVELDDLDMVAKTLAAKGLIFARRGRLNEAFAACDASLKHDPHQPGPYATKAWMYLNTDRLDEAGDAITLALKIVETDVDWRQECRFLGAKWSFYVTQGSILNALSERYGDPTLAVEAIEATQKAWDDFEASPSRPSPTRAELGAQIFLERAYASVLCDRSGAAAGALKEARRLAPRDSRPWLAATRALGQVPTPPPMIPSLMIVAAEVIGIAGSVVLLVERDIASGPFVTLVIGLVALGLIAFFLPVMTRFRVGTLELEKVVASTSARAIPRLAAPPPRPQVPRPRPQVSRWGVASQWPASQ